VLRGSEKALFLVLLQNWKTTLVAVAKFIVPDWGIKSTMGFNKYIHTKYTWKVQCHEIFCSWFISWISFPPSSWVYHLGRFEFFQKFAEIFAAQCWPPVSTTPAANFATSFTSVVDTRDKFATGYNNTGGKFAAGVNNIGGKLPPVSTTPAANLPPVSTTSVANNGINIRLQIP